jgi:hypothetical protein
MVAPANTADPAKKQFSGSCKSATAPQKQRKRSLKVGKSGVTMTLFCEPPPPGSKSSGMRLMEPYTAAQSRGYSFITSQASRPPRTAALQRDSSANSAAMALLALLAQT